MKSKYYLQLSLYFSFLQQSFISQYLLNYLCKCNIGVNYRQLSSYHEIDCINSNMAVFAEFSFSKPRCCEDITPNFFNKLTIIVLMAF